MSVSATAGLLAAGQEPQDCPGCADHPLDECAACGKRAMIALPCGEHSMTLCGGCWQLVKEIRAESAKRKAAAKTRKRKSATVAAASATEAA